MHGDAQARAAALALARSLLLVTGGPGTGKTTAIARLLLLLVAQARLQAVDAPRIALAKFRQQIRRTDDAIQLFDQVLTLQPGHFGALSLKALMLLQGRRLDEAEVAYRDFIRTCHRRGGPA